jgi:pseudouridine kinase
MRFTVIGAANVDIISKSSRKIIHGDSNPADVRLLPGGVARNIAENLSRLGAEVCLITAIGTDPLGAFLRENCKSCGIGTEAWIVRENMDTGVYSAALDCDGELYAAFNAMAALESINADDLAPYAQMIGNADLLVADANLTEDALGAVLALRGGGPVAVDAVSVAKAPRIGRLLPKINLLKLNRAEAECLTGLALDTDEKLKLACTDLISRGVKRAFITLGAAGVCAADSDGVHFIPAVPVTVENVTGAGDAFFAGVALCFRDGLTQQAKYGAKLAARHLEGTFR